MGEYNAFIDRINRRCEDLPYLERENVEWRKTADDIGLLGDLDTDVIDFIGMWPAEMVSTITALVAAAATSRARLRFAWMPGVDFSATIAKANADPAGQAEYTVLLQSRYPHEVKRANV